MISEKELDEIAKEKTGSSDSIRLHVGFKIGFRAAEKIYLDKIAELKDKSYLTRKIIELEARLKSARELIQFCNEVTHHEIRCNFPFHECGCMNRDIYNEGKILNATGEWLKNEGGK